MVQQPDTASQQRPAYPSNCKMGGFRSSLRARCDRWADLWTEFHQSVAANERCMREMELMDCVVLTVEETKTVVCDECITAMLFYLRQSGHLGGEERLVETWLSELTSDHLHSLDL